jgi:SAM-dependent methyltransferase
MEGLYPILMERRKAARVVGYDRMPSSEKIKVLREKLGTRFEYIYGMELPEMGAAVLKGQEGLFDVVVCGGLLYHAFDPLTALCRVRAMVRPGGILLLETAAVLSDDYSMHFNAHGDIFNACSNFWFPSVRCVDYLARYARLRPIDCCWLYEGYRCAPSAATEASNNVGEAIPDASLAKSLTGDHRYRPAVRLAIALRSEPSPVAAKDDKWLGIQWDFDSVRNFYSLINWQAQKVQLPPLNTLRIQTNSFFATIRPV